MTNIITDDVKTHDAYLDIADLTGKPVVGADIIDHTAEIQSVLEGKMITQVKRTTICKHPANFIEILSA